MDINLLRQANAFFELMKDADKKKALLQEIIAGKEQIAASFTELEAIEKDTEENHKASVALLASAQADAAELREKAKKLEAKELAIKASSKELAESLKSLKKQQAESSVLSEDLKGKAAAFNEKAAKASAEIEAMKAQAAEAKLVYDTKLAALKKTMGE